MRSSVEFSIDLTAQALLAPDAPNAPAKKTSPVAEDADAVEIELTAEQMNALLEGNLEL